ncbi:MAG: MBL fold metallo-hydrolase [Halodesulfurarchaeum sp.]
MKVENLTADADVFTANAYLLEGEHPTMVDVGAMPGVVDRIESRIDRLDRVVLTHQHGDHIAELGAVVEAFDPTILAASETDFDTRRIVDGEHVRLGNGSFEVVHTPGHADDHVSLVGSGTVFSGDVVVYSDEAFDDGSFGRTDNPGQSRERLIESLETLLKRMPDDVSTMYPGHGDSFEGAVRGVVERALERARRREPKYPDG